MYADLATAVATRKKKGPIDMKQLIEYCEELLADDEVQLQEKSNGELARWVKIAKQQIALAVVPVPLSEFMK